LSTGAREPALNRALSNAIVMAQPLHPVNGAKSLIGEPQ